MTDLHDLGLEHDLEVLEDFERRTRGRWGRRKMLTVIGGATAGAALLAACGDKANRSATSTTSAGGGSSPTSSTAVTNGSAAVGSSGTTSTATVAEETAGPFPGDGTNGPNVLNESGVVRRDIRTSFGSMSGTAKGVLLTIVLNLRKNGRPYDGGAVYVWHCTAEGGYTLYSQGVTDQNYLRGVQAAGSDGKVTFTSVFPACYDGRWPHIHFEVYESLATAGSAANKIHTSQMALPEDACKAVYATSAYPNSMSNLSRVSLTRDMVFRDSYQTELATMTGDVTNGYVAELTVNA